MSQTVCRHCGQLAPTRCGVILPPLKTRIFDVIGWHSKSRGGISTEDLAGWIYPGAPAFRARDRIKSHVCQINDRLAETDYTIRKSDPDGYRLIKLNQEQGDEKTRATGQPKEGFANARTNRT